MSSCAPADGPAPAAATPDTVYAGNAHIQNTRIYAQISHPLREATFRELERHPKIVRIA